MIRVKLMIAAAAAAMAVFPAQAGKTAKALLENGGATLRFVYDEEDAPGVLDKDWFLVSETETV